VLFCQALIKYEFNDINIHIFGFKIKSFIFTRVKKIIQILLIACLPSLSIAQLPSGGLVAWYPFCGNTNDYSGNGYNLHDSGAVLTTDRFGSPDCAYSFNGINNIMYCTPPLPTDTGNFTYSAWFILDTPGNMLIISNGNNNIDGYEMLITGPVLLSIGSDDAVIFGGINQYLPTPITLHQWHQTVLRRRAPSTFDFIIDTVLIGTFTATFNLTHTYEDFAVGMDFTNGTNAFQGKLDDIAVYNRALSDTEIRQLYHYDPVCTTVTSSACDSISMPDTLYACNEVPVTLSATLYGSDSVYSILWTPSTGLSNPAILSPTLTIATSGWYHLTVKTIIPGNLVVNGDFSAGSTGFSTSYTPEPTGSTCNGCSAVDINPHSYDASWVSMGDHTTGTGKMLIVDGALSYPVNFWCESIPVMPNTDYLFSFWMASTYPSPLASIEVKINGIVIGAFSPSGTSGIWNRYRVTWNSGTSTLADICLDDLVTASFGNDLVVDDIAFNQLCIVKDSVYIDLIAAGTTYGSHDTSACFPVTNVTLNAPGGYSSYHWSTGATSTSVTVDSGSYWVVASIGCALFIDTFHVISITPSTTSVVKDTFVCADSLITLAAPGGYSSYLWNTGSSGSSITVSSGIYSVKATGNCSFSFDTFRVAALPLPIVHLGNDTSICTGQSVTLSSPQPTGSQYLWSNGSTGASIVVSSVGSYSLTVTKNGCSGSDLINVSEIKEPLVSLGADTVLCKGSELVLSANSLNSNTLLWSTGDNEPSIKVTTSGNYWVKAANGCTSTSDTVKVDFEMCDIWLPSAFSPNNDGLNDLLRVIGHLGKYRDFAFSVYNRWGQRVFYTDDIYNGWDGKFNGVDQDLGTYFYMLNYSLEGQKHMMKGDIHLIR